MYDTVGGDGDNSLFFNLLLSLRLPTVRSQVKLRGQYIIPIVEYLYFKTERANTCYSFTCMFSLQVTRFLCSWTTFVFSG
jgi:hypothetical protein